MSIPELTLMLGTAFIGISTVLQVIKKNLVSCKLCGCTCEYQNQNINMSPRSENIGLLTTRKNQEIAEIDDNVKKIRNSFTLHKSLPKRSQSFS